MIQVKVGTNTKRETLVLAESATPKQALNQAGVDYSTATIHLDGSVIKAAEMNKSLADLGITESCTLIAVIKTDNA